jgi:hypothetical protein
VQQRHVAVGRHIVTQRGIGYRDRSDGAQG